MRERGTRAYDIIADDPGKHPGPSSSEKVYTFRQEHFRTSELESPAAALRTGETFSNHSEKATAIPTVAGRKRYARGQAGRTYPGFTPLPAHGPRRLSALPSSADASR